MDLKDKRDFLDVVLETLMIIPYIEVENVFVRTYHKSVRKILYMT